MKRSTAPAATWRTGSRSVSSISMRSHLDRHHAGKSAAPVVCLNGLCAAVCLAPASPYITRRLAKATSGTIRLKLLKIGALVPSECPGGGGGGGGGGW